MLCLSQGVDRAGQTAERRLEYPAMVVQHHEILEQKSTWRVSLVLSHLFQLEHIKKNQENENKQEMMQPDFMLHAAKNVAANLPGAKR